MSTVSCSSVSDAQQGALQYQIQIAILAKQQTAARQEGEAVQSLLEGALTLAKEAGLGDSFDAQA